MTFTVGSASAQIYEIDLVNLTVHPYVNQSVMPGEPFYSYAKVHNREAFDVSVKVVYYLSTDNLYSPDDTLLYEYASLVPQNQYGDTQIVHNLTVPANCPDGDYHVIAIAYQEGGSPDVNMGTNIRTATIKVLRDDPAFWPDLIITSITGPANVTLGQAVTLNVTIKNVGSTALYATNDEVPLRYPYLGIDFRPVMIDIGTQFYYDRNGSTPAHVRIGPNSTFLQPFYLWWLAPGESVSLHPTVPIDSTFPLGSMHIVVKINCERYMKEKDYRNDIASFPIIVVQNTSPAVDLRIVNLTAPSTGNAGSSIPISCTVENAGRADSGSFNVYYYVMANPASQPGSLNDGASHLYNLAPGRKVLTPEVWIPSGLLPGTYYLVGSADYWDVIAESDETNNLCVSGPISIGLSPDLIITRATVPGKGVRGGKINVLSTVKNIGTSNAGRFNYSLYISPDMTINTSDRLIDTRTVTTLAVGATQGTSYMVTIPDDLGFSGRCYIGILIDVDNTVPEAEEANNAYGPMPIFIRG